MTKPATDDVRAGARRAITLRVNREDLPVTVAEHHTLLEVLREDLDLTGTKHGCELGECGACTVLVDGQPWLSCLVLAVDVEGRELTTVEGLGSAHTPDALQTAFAELGAAQCGYCTPGMLVTARALLDAEPEPDRDQVKQSLAGNMCRCTGYLKIIDAVLLAAEREVAGSHDGEETDHDR